MQSMHCEIPDLDNSPVYEQSESGMRIGWQRKRRLQDQQVVHVDFAAGDGGGKSAGGMACRT
jgi:hypothetical protein